MAVRSDVTFDDNFVDLRDGSWTVDLKYLSFEKAMPEKDKSCKRKRPAVSGSRTDSCATPPFAKVVASSKIQSLYESLEKAGKANLLAQTLKGNEFKPCDFFEHSGNPAQESAPSSNFMEMSYDIFKNMHAEMDSSLFAKATSASIAHNVGVTLQDIKVIEKETRKQASSHRWFLERSKRLTSSLFGRILRRRENVFPKSILDQIAKRRDGTGPNTAGLQWGIEKEKVALERAASSFAWLSELTASAFARALDSWPTVSSIIKKLIIMSTTSRFGHYQSQFRTTRPSIPKPRKTFRARNRDVLVVLNPNKNVDRGTQNGIYENDKDGEGGEAITLTPEYQVIALQGEMHALQKREMLEL
eukprot:gene7412-13168_t